MAPVMGNLGKIEIANDVSTSLDATEACTKIDTSHFYISNAAHRLLDPDVSYTVQKNTGSGYTTVPSSQYYIRYGGAVVCFYTPLGGTDTVQITSGKYFPFSTLTWATGWKMDFAKDEYDVTKLTDTWKMRQLYMGKGTVTIDQFTYDEFFFNQLGNYIGAKLYLDASGSNKKRWEIIGHITKDDLDVAVNKLQTNPITIEIESEPNYAEY